jgi:glycosyltransferase involved in cell wall biosynthesis
LDVHIDDSTAPDVPHVLLVVPWDQTQGGVNTVVRNLARLLQESGETPLFLFPGGTMAPRDGVSRLGFPSVSMNLRPPVVRRRPFRSALAFLLTAPIVLRHLVRLVRARRIDVVNVHYPDANFIYFIALRWLTGVRLVTSVHGADLTTVPKPSSAHRWMGRLLARSDVVVAPSQEFADYVRSEYPALAGRVVGIPNGVDVQAVRDMASDAAGPPGWSPPTGPYCICVAALNEKKAHDTLLRALALVPGPMRLILVGDGPLRAELTSLVTTLGLDERVEFAGVQQPPVVAKLLAGAQCAVLASRNEPFGIAAVEAMAVGTPVIVSNAGGLREIVIDDESGLVVPVDDARALAAALIRLTSDGELRRRLGAAGAERARLFDWRERTARYLDLAYADAGAVLPAGDRLTPSVPAADRA